MQASWELWITSLQNFHLGGQLSRVAVLTTTLSSGITLAALANALRPLLELPIESVLISHGKPVLSGGRAALAEALGWP